MPSTGESSTKFHTNKQWLFVLEINHGILPHRVTTAASPELGSIRPIKSKPEWSQQQFKINRGTSGISHAQCQRVQVSYMIWWPRPPCLSLLLHWHISLNSHLWQQEYLSCWRRKKAEFISLMSWLNVWLQAEKRLLLLQLFWKQQLLFGISLSFYLFYILSL